VDPCRPRTFFAPRKCQRHSHRLTRTCRRQVDTPQGKWPDPPGCRRQPSPAAQ
jgi:hypothetical protein